MKKYVLILGAGFLQKPSIEAAKELGYEAIVIDANPHAVCVPFADRFEKIDLKDREKIAEFAFSLGKELCGVFTAGTDFSASVSYAAQKCGLISHSFEAAMNASNKILMRECFKRNGIPSPDFFEADEEFLSQVECGKKIGLEFPKVVKPVDNMGARGCRLARNQEEFIFALKEAVKFSRTKKAVVEDYMKGREFSVDALVSGGRIVVTGFADRHIFFEPYFVELGHTMPSVADESEKKEVIKVFSDAVFALGLTDGVAKGDMKLTEKGAMVGEIAARLSGGYMSGWTFPYSSGFNLTKAAMEISLGIKKSFPTADEIFSVKTSAERAFISIPGVVKKIYGADSAAACPFVKDVFFRVKENDRVVFPRNNVEKCGNVISLAPENRLAVSGAENAVSRFVLRLEPADDETENFLSGAELPQEKGFPFSAYDFDFDAEEIFRGTDEKFIGENSSAAEFFSSVKNENFWCTKDWNFRSVRQTLFLFDEICRTHGKLDAKKFIRFLIRGGIQGILFYADSEAADEK
jgi:biotin carboxylase